MNIEPILSIKPLVRNEKNIIYNGIKYPIDFDSLKKNSNYFYSNRKHYKNINDINLQTEQIEVSNEAFQTFISCCQNKSFQLNDNNVYPLHQLSIQYEVPELIQLTKQYISKNKKNLYIQIILFKNQIKDGINHDINNVIGSTDTTDEEELISSQIFEYINNDQFLLLPIPVLYRIFYNYNLDLNELNETEQNIIINFFFKCLDKYKRNASILFINLDLESKRSDLLKKLLNQYSDIFDFNMINSKSLAQTTSELFIELNKLQIICSNQLNEINEFKKNQNEKIETQQNLFESLLKETKEQFDNFVVSIKQEIYDYVKTQNNDQKDYFNKITEEIKTKHESLQDQQNSVQSQLNLFQSRLNSLKDKQKSFSKDLKDTQDELKKLSQNQGIVDEHDNQIQELKKLISKIKNSLKENKELTSSNHKKTADSIVSKYTTQNKPKSTKKKLMILSSSSVSSDSFSSDSEDLLNKQQPSHTISTSKIDNDDDDDDCIQYGSKFVLNSSSSNIYSGYSLNSKYTDAAMFESDDPYLYRKKKNISPYDKSDMFKQKHSSSKNKSLYDKSDIHMPKQTSSIKKYDYSNW